MPRSSPSCNDRRCLLSQELFADGILTALKPSSEHDGKHVLWLETLRLLLI